MWLIDYAASYEIGKWKLGDVGEPWQLALQPYVGATYFHDPIKIRLCPGLLDRGLKINKTIEFNTPMAGMETHRTFNDSWTMWIGGHYAGFDVDGVDEMYQAVGMMAYYFKIKETSSQLLFGYKFIHLEYEDDPLKIHVDIKGPRGGGGRRRFLA